VLVLALVLALQDLDLEDTVLVMREVVLQFMPPREAQELECMFPNTIALQLPRILALLVIISCPL
jgi:hypothetical protein